MGKECVATIYTVFFRVDALNILIKLIAWNLILIIELIVSLFQLTVMVLKVVKCYNIDVLKEEWRLLLKS
ncbi:hypothetical protein HMPREF2706_11695 [Staphylococcus sp. HMSC067F07]|nr:hypothetical protein HMPREF2706_11695 [Staphylococcus sp. HMSC067F07]